MFSMLATLTIDTKMKILHSESCKPWCHLSYRELVESLCESFMVYLFLVKYGCMAVWVTSKLQLECMWKFPITTSTNRKIYPRDDSTDQRLP
jgi:hypothetical protein